MHSREHIVIMRPGERGLLLHTMYFADEVRKTDEFRTDTENIREKELALALNLVESLSAEFEPQKYTDTYRDNLRKMIQAKIDGNSIVETPETHIAPVIDIMEALKKSLEMRKPPAVAETISAEEPARASARSRRPAVRKAGGA
jgi:DNA end-binding protein Ku